MKNRMFITGLCLIGFSAFGQPKQEILDYVAKYKDVAIEEMVRTNIPASITLAQGILESGCGLSPLAVKANNHFGIKCKSEWDGKKFFQDDDAPNECFRVYDDARDSYADHSDFLLTRPRYADLFKLPAGDYKDWAYGLKAAGYATNPHYATQLIKYIEDYQLHQYDDIGYAQIKQHDKMMTAPYQTDEELAKSLPTTATTPDLGKTGATTTTDKDYIVNGLRAIKAIGTVDPFTVAFDYNIDYNHIMAFNDLGAGEKFEDGENIFLQPKKNKAAVSTYQVNGTESMRDISQKFGIKLKELYLKNLMTGDDQLAAGETAYLQAKREQVPKTISYSEYLKNVAQSETKSTAKSLADNSAYEVQQKDTLYSIAQRFNTTVEKIKEMNNLDGSNIHAGQTLVVYQ